MKRVYVVAWEYEGGGGFDWYNTPEEADKAYETESEQDTIIGQLSYRFDYIARDGDRAAITREIDEEIWQSGVDLSTL